MEVVSLNKIFSQNAYCLSQRLNTTIAKEINKPILYIVFGGHEKPHVLLESQKRCNCRYLILNSEHYSSMVFKNKYYLQLLKENFVCDYLPENRQWLKENYNINVLSYFWFEFMRQPPSTNRPIDLLFVGAWSKFRQETEKELKSKYSKLNIQFVYPKEYTDITELLLTAKNVLNLPFYDNNFETHRINQALACGANVISYETNSSIKKAYQNFVYWGFTDTGPKSSYEELVKHQLNNIQSHFNWIVSMLIRQGQRCSRV